MPLIEVRNLRKAYGSVAALDGISLEVERGEWLAMMGPSGSGKTTLLNILGGLDSPTSGQVLIDGADTSVLTGSDLALFRARKVGFVFQQFHLVPYLSVLDNVLTPSLAKSTQQARGRAQDLIARFGLGKRQHHIISQWCVC